MREIWVMADKKSLMQHLSVNLSKHWQKKKPSYSKKIWQNSISIDQLDVRIL